MPKKEAPLKEKNGPPEEKKGPPEMTYGSQIYPGSPKVLRGTQGARDVFTKNYTLLKWSQDHGGGKCTISGLPPQAPASLLN